MSAMRRLFTLPLNFVTGRRDDDPLREEMEQHLAMQMEENTRAGMPFADARRRRRCTCVNGISFDERRTQPWKEGWIDADIPLDAVSSWW